MSLGSLTDRVAISSTNVCQQNMPKRKWTWEQCCKNVVSANVWVVAIKTIVHAYQVTNIYWNWNFKQTYSHTLVQAKDYQGLVHGNHPYASGCDATSTTANVNAEGHATLTLLHFIVIYSAGHLVMFPGLNLTPQACMLYILQWCSGFPPSEITVGEYPQPCFSLCNMLEVANQATATVSKYHWTYSIKPDHLSPFRKVRWSGWLDRLSWTKQIWFTYTICFSF